MLAANMADDMLEKALIMRPLNALVAQLDRVLGYEPSGRRFESSRVRHIEDLLLSAGQTADEPRIFAGFRFSGTLAMIFPVLTDSACEGTNSLRVAALLAS